MDRIAGAGWRCIRGIICAVPSAACADSGHYALSLQVGTGKTSLVRQYVHKTFSNNYKSTIGALSLPPHSCRSLTSLRTPRAVARCAPL